MITVKHFFMMLLLLTAGCGPGSNEKDRISGSENEKKHLIIETDAGDIEIVLFEKQAPQTVENIVKLASGNFYDGMIFHRVEPGKFVMGGDPMGTGAGGPGYTLPMEINELEHSTGTVSMARLPDYVNPQKLSSGSQFFICLSSQPSFNSEFTVFGRITKGFEAAQAVQQGDVMKRVYLAE